MRQITTSLIVTLFLGLSFSAVAEARNGVAILCPDVNGPGAGWGVGFVDANLSPENVYGPLSVTQAIVTSPDHRVFYPSFAFIAPDQKTKEILTERPVLPEFVQGIVREAMDNAQPRCRIFFLFKGTQPLRIMVGTNPPMSFELPVEKAELQEEANFPPPQNRQEARIARRAARNSQLVTRNYYTLLNRWFMHYFPEVTKREKILSPEPPATLKNYLRAMLVYRLRLNPQAIEPKESPWDSVSPFNFTAATAKLRSQMAYVSFFEDNKESYELQATSSENTLPHNSVNDSASEDKTLTTNNSQSATPIEPIAMRVPKNCVYVRFGSFANFMWFQKLNASVQGDMGNLFFSQSMDRGNSDKMQMLLASRQTEIGEMMGPTVIQDVAFIGTDLFVDDGPSFGLLFHATNSFLLSTGLNGERAKILKENPDAKEKTVKVAGKKVKYLYTPDGRIHSYYAIDDMFHLVTTSKKIVELFFATKDKTNALGAQEYFHKARAEMPLKNKYTVFFYASEDFMRQFISPQYWTEIMRRRRSAAEIEMVLMARQAAQNEGLQSTSIEELVKYGFLPRSVLNRPDGSQLMYDDKGAVYDTKRGYPGLFRPVVDMEVTGMSDYEQRRYNMLLDSFQKQVVQLTPMMGGIMVKEEKGGDKSEKQSNDSINDLVSNSAEETASASTPQTPNSTIIFEAHIAPYAKARFDKIKSYFGPEDRVRFAFVQGDCIQAQAILNNARLLMGVRNDMPNQDRTGHLVADILGGIYGKDLGLYFGTTNQAGFIGLLGTFDVAPLGPPAEYTIHSTPDLDMRYRDQRIKLFSPEPEIPPQVEPYLCYELAPTPQHGWISVHDPMSVPIGWRINDMCYAVSARTSLHNLISLHTAIQQLGVNPADALTVFERRSAAKLVSPLGGKYVYQPLSENFGYWTDTALGTTTMRNLGWFSVHAPEGYLSSPWTWFRGAEIQFKIESEKIILTGTIEYQE